MCRGSLASVLVICWTALVFTALPARAVEIQSTASDARVAILQQGSKQPEGRPYSVSIFLPANSVDQKPKMLLRQIDLGVHKQPLHLLDGADLKLYAVAAMTSDRERKIIALDPKTGLERYRLSAGRVPYGDGDRLPWHKISGDRLLLVTYASSGPKNLRGWSLRAFERLTGKEIYSLHLGRKEVFSVLSQGGSLLIEQRPGSGGGKYDYRVVDAASGELKVMGSASYRYKPRGFLSPDGNYFYKVTRSKISGMAKKSGARAQEAVSGWLSMLAVHEVNSGELLETHELGYSLTQVIAGLEDGALYAAAQQSLVNGGVVVWKISGDEVGVARRSSTACATKGLYVNRKSDAATVFCSDGFEHGPLGQEAVVRLGKSRVVPLRITASADQQTLYVESAKQSCVLKVSLAEMEASRCKKTGSAANRMLAAAGGYSSPLNFTHRSLLLSEETARLYVLNEMAGDITLFDTKRFDKLGTVNLGGGANRLLLINISGSGKPPMVLGVAGGSLVLLRAGARIKAGARTDLEPEVGAENRPLQPLWRMPKGGRFLALTNENTLAWFVKKDTLTVVNLLDQTTVFEQANFGGALAGRVLR